MTNVPSKMKYLECVFDLCAEDHDEPVEAGEEEDDDDEPVGHDVVARLNLQIEVWIPFFWGVSIKIAVSIVTSL